MMPSGKNPGARCLRCLGTGLSGTKMSCLTAQPGTCGSLGTRAQKVEVCSLLI